MPPAGAQRPALPAELAENLSPQDHAIVWLMVGGRTWQQALDAVGVSPRAEIRDNAPREEIRAAAEWLCTSLAEQSGVSRSWLLSQWVALYERASTAVPVLDRQGEPTGLYKFDGATAAKCLTALSEVAGLKPPPGSGDPRFSANQVADLMAAVAARGKPTLEQRRERIIGASSAAPHHDEKA